MIRFWICQKIQMRPDALIVPQKHARNTRNVNLLIFESKFAKIEINIMSVLTDPQIKDATSIKQNKKSDSCLIRMNNVNYIDQIYLVDFVAELMFIQMKFSYNLKAIILNLKIQQQSIQIMIKKPNKKKKELISKSKSKSTHKRVNTFNNSQFSAIDQKLERNFASSSVCDLFRHTSIKLPKFQNASIVISTGRPVKKKNVQKGGASLGVVSNGNNKKKTKKVKPKSKPKLKKQIEPYEYVFLHPSHSNSDIVFSNEDTNRESQISNQAQGDKRNQKVQYHPIKFEEQYSIGKKIQPKKAQPKHKQQVNRNSNLNKNYKTRNISSKIEPQLQNQALRNSIKQRYWIQYEAATKIQKVFRGYLTRKILNKYIFHQEQQLSRRIEQIKGNSFKNSYNVQQFKKLINFDDQGLFEDDFYEVADQQVKKQFIQFKRSKAIQRSYDRSQDISLNTFQDDSKNQFEISQISNNFNLGQKEKMEQSQSQQSQYLRREIKDRRKHHKSYPQNYQELDKAGVNNQEQQQEQPQESQQDSSDNEPVTLAYRHQQPIYSHQDISQFLDQNSDQQYEQQQDEYQPNVIFETNEQYIQSRKSSLQNKHSTKNQLAAAKNNQSQESNQRSYFNERNQNFQQKNRLKKEIFQPRQFSEQDSLQEQRKFSLQISNFNKNKFDITLFEKSADSKAKKQIQGLPTLPSQHLSTEEHKQTEQSSQKLDCNAYYQPYTYNYNLTFHSDEDTKLLTETYSFPAQQKLINDSSKSRTSDKNIGIERMKVISFDSQQKSELKPQSEREKMIRKMFPKQMKSGANSNSSHSLKSSVQQIGVKKLKESQKKRWQEISKMIAHQVKQNELKNSQLSSFMKSIQQMCQKNKESLSQEDLDQNNYQTPMTTIDAHRGSNQMTDSSSKKQFDTIDQKPQQQVQGAEMNNQFKKKNLKIQIVNGDVRNQERLSLSKSKDRKEKGFKKDICQKKLQESFSPRNIAQPIVPKPMLAISQKRKSKEQLKQLNKLRISQFQEQQNRDNLQQEVFLSSSKVSQSQRSATQHKIYELKNFLAQNIQNDSLNQMLRLRQQLLLKRQSQMLVKLNQELSEGKLSQTEFIQKLGTLTSKFEQQKVSIDRAKEDIERGYQAAMGLVRQTYKDAKKLGAKINFCKSLGNIKIKDAKILQNLIVDQFQCFTPKNKVPNLNKLRTQQIVQRSEPKKQQPNLIFNNSKKQFEDEFSQSSSVEFTQEQLQRFRKIKPYDYEFAQMNRNIAIGDQFMKQHFVQTHNNENKHVQRQAQEKIQSAIFFESSGKIKLTSQAYRQVYEVDIDDSQNLSAQKAYPQSDPIKDKLAQLQFQKVIYECAIQILERPILNQKLLDRSYLTRPKKISFQQQLLFINILQKNFPEDGVLLKKLNQKISPLPCELLKCMRIQFNEQSENDQTLNDVQNLSNQDNDYEQIGKYQFIIGQDVCAQSLSQFRDKIQLEQNKSSNSAFKATLKEQFQIKQKQIISSLKQQNHSEKQLENEKISTFEQLNEKFNFEDKSVKYMTQRQRFIQNKIKHTKGLRWQILNIEVHSIFDAWNEQIIQLRSKKSGFSGIGLNQLTISIMDQNKILTLVDVKPIINQGKQKVLSILNDDSDLNQKMLKQNFEEMCQTDSTWIFYADQALSYGLQIGYMVQEQIFNECARQIMKKILGIQLNYFTGQQNSIASSSEQDYEHYQIGHMRNNQSVINESESDSGYY